MQRPIGLDNEAPFKADEIDDVGPDRDLSTKFQTVQAAPPQQVP